MKTQYKFLIVFLSILDIFCIERIIIGSHLSPILTPQGIISLQERNLLFSAVALILLILIPFFLLALYVGIRYHAGAKKADYRPDWEHNTTLQILIWALPTLIICLLSGLVWVYAHKLDPHVAISGQHKPMTIQVVALRWKWLFLYPEQRIATVNYVEFPENTPINFELTASDSPMTSFWIPQLGGQIYAMSGMATQTHLMANGVGEYRGSNAEISGAGFASMTFQAKSVSQNDFASWVSTVKQMPQALTLDQFEKINIPYEDNTTLSYSSTVPDLYTTIVMKYMSHNQKQPNQMQDMSSMSGM